MQDARTLHPEDTVSHYRIIGPLGAGGMGEVYLAQDQNLDRNVALKVLPASLIRNEDRVRRFVLEAKSASSLNHPNIVTIYEIGQEGVQGSDGSTSSPIHFISMELVSGETLSTKIHHEKTDLRSLLGYLAQAADGISKAHAAGIVHRDLKPGNIMVSKDGFAKVLDFGLAKLTEKRESNPELTNAPTLTEATSLGAVLGTVGYMSPEQVAGKPVDGRSDIFSFGCILYEAATRQQAFSAETGIETMHKILNERPVPIEDLNPNVPAELRRVIRRCLAKSPDQRAQSMKDVAIEVREIVDEFDALSASASSGSGASAVGSAPGGMRPKRGFPVLPVAGAIAVAGVALALWSAWNSRQSARAGAPPDLRITTQTNRGDVSESAISPDGRYLAYIISQAGQGAVHVRQVATGSDVEVVPMMPAELFGLTFSPDGNYLFFLGPKQDSPRYRALYQVPSLGGQPQERAFDVDTRVTFSPDGKQFAFIRGVPSAGNDLLIVRNLEGGPERTLAKFDEPNQNWTPPAWSPDGRKIAVGFFRGAPSLHTRLVFYPLDGGKPDVRPPIERYETGDIAWLRDGSALVMDGTDLARGFNRQLSLLRTSGGRSPITNGMSTYLGASASSGDEAVAAVRVTSTANLWVADAEGGAPLAVTSFTNPENAVAWIAVADSATLLYGAGLDRGQPLFAVPARGGTPRKLTQTDGLCFDLSGYNGGAIFGWLDEKGNTHVWKVNADGSGLSQLTNGSGEQPAAVASDGRYFSYHVADGAVQLMAMQGGAPIGFKDPATAQIVRGGGKFSPDGSLFEFGVDVKMGDRSALVVHVIPVRGGAELRADTLPISVVGDLVWGPGTLGSSVTLGTDSRMNVHTRFSWEAGYKQVTHFADGRVASFQWSPDGSRLAVVRDIGGVQNLWITDAKGDHVVQATRFTQGVMPAISWMPDSRRVAVRAGPHTSDAVLVRNFR